MHLAFWLNHERWGVHILYRKVTCISFACTVLLRCVLQQNFQDRRSRPFVINLRKSKEDAQRVETDGVLRALRPLQQRCCVVGLFVSCQETIAQPLCAVKLFPNSQGASVNDNQRSRAYTTVDSILEEGQRAIYNKSWAVVVGVNQYRYGLPPLSNAQNDAQAVAEVLRDLYQFDEVHTLYNDQATRRALMSWLRDELPRRTAKNDRVIFFFAGHGVTQPTRLGGKRGYLAPYDAEAGKYVDYIDMRELLEACSLMEAKHILLILDCCFSGVAAVSARATPSTTPEVLNDIYLRRITEKGAWQILTAGDSDDQVADSSLRANHHSVFTSVLLEGLKGAADHNNDTLFTATDLAAYVKPRVTRESAIDTGRSQAPFFNYLASSEQGEFVFVLPQPKVTFPIDFDWVTILAGEFLMGSDKQKDPQANDNELNELPQHHVYLPEYRISCVPVTNAQYKMFVEATCYRFPEHWKNEDFPIGQETHPVANVSWTDAQAFCDWAGVRLPTEAEWEKAARGTDGRIWPWGNDPPTPEHCNFNENVGCTTPVGSYPPGASSYGVLDMAGNVWEWTADWFDNNYYANSPSSNPKGPATGYHRTLRGGSFELDSDWVRCACRCNPKPAYIDATFGFRVVVSSAPGF